MCFLWVWIYRLDIEFQIDFVLIESDNYTKFIGPVQGNSSFITHFPSNQLCRTFDRSMNFLSKIIETSYFGGWTSMHGLMAGRASSIWNKLCSFNTSCFTCVIPMCYQQYHSNQTTRKSYPRKLIPSNIAFFAYFLSEFPGTNS